MKQPFKILILGILVLLATAKLTDSANAHGIHKSPISDAYNSRMIDDGIFINSGTMSEAAIQSFLQGKVPNCQQGYTCLKDYVDPGVGKRASRIIWEEAQNVGINPQVILVTLQKEQSLVTDDFPFDVQYRTAMGYGCPESQSVCDSQYYGFYNQVRLGAKLLRVGHDRNCGNTSSFPGWSVNSQWRLGNTPTVDGKPTFMGTCATGSLYNYTPHRPDSGWLTATNGSHYYGNYNFVSFFTSWFGSTHVPAFSWQYVSQSANRDLGNLMVGEQATLTVTARNTGTQTWSNSGPNPVRLGTSRPSDRASGFATGSWLGPNRPANLNEGSVAPGSDGTFTFVIQAPGAVGVHREYFNLLSEGQTWMNDPGQHFHINVVPRTYNYSITSQEAYTDSSKTSGLGLGNLSPGQTGWLVLRARNIGNVSWSNSGANPVRLGTFAPLDRPSRYGTGAWAGANRPSGLIESSVAPGAIGTFEFPIRVPAGGGTFFERFNLVAEGATWMNDTGLGYFTRVNGGYGWNLISQEAYTSNAKTTGVDLTNLSPGQTVYLRLVARNSGNATWYKASDYPARLGTSRPLDRSSAFAHGSWLGYNRPAALIETSVAPGANGSFEFHYRAPSQTGTYREYFNPLIEGITWLNDIGLNFYTVVR